ncbi:doublesex- and mab-3-related transcription factor A2 [Condylostylus longicornis]|uniref:doublesex- and mab-3-related transcription factor A2 n=1 Tax=Condylostylus longicornis TaxID=2530218 RepID=UPI00244DF3C5|nr:doublesex- and mab-3-related transcription factor A2 [Condylostylus longicornis]
MGSLKVALKRQQAVEDAIALRLASNEKGVPLETLPPGKIFGMTVTNPCNSPPPPPLSSSPTISDKDSVKSTSSNSSNPTVSQSAIDMLAQLFPHRKRSVLELVLKRCDLDLLRAIEQCSPSQSVSAFRPPSSQVPSTSCTSTITLPSSSTASSSASVVTPIQIPINQPTPLPPQPHYTPLIAYPKWLLPMSIPVTMGHLPNLAPRCTLPNCPCMDSFHLN